MIKNYILLTFLLSLTICNFVNSLNRAKFQSSPLMQSPFIKVPILPFTNTLQNHHALTRGLITFPQSPLIPLSSNLTTTQTAASRIGITQTPFLNFTFPTDKLAQAGSVFHTTKVETSVSTLPNFSNSTFSGFSNVYKSQMAYLIAGIKDLNTTQGRMLSDKLTMDLIAVDNTLKLVNMNKSRQLELKPLLQFQVKQFLTDLDMVQDHLLKQKSSVVIGDKNLVMGKAGQVEGNNNTLIGHNSMITGNDNSLIGNQSIVSGFNNGVSGNKGVTIGLNNSVNASNSFVFTSNDVITKNNTLVVGNNTIDLTKLHTGGGRFLTNN